MFKWIFFISFIFSSAMASAQRISVDHILAFMKGKTITHIEDSLKKKSFTLTKTESSLDKSRVLYIYSQKKGTATSFRSLELSNFAAVAPKGRQITYSTNDATEYNAIVEEFKKNGFEETNKGNMGSGIDYWNFSGNDLLFQLMRKPVRNPDGSKTFSYSIQVMPF